MSERWRVTRLDELGSVAPNGQPEWFRLRMELGLGAFGANAWRAAEAGQRVISDHDESSDGHEELYVVLSGHATFTVDENEVDAPAGTLVFVGDPKLRRGARAKEPDTTVLVVGAAAGKAFVPSNWEADAEGLGYFATKEYDEAIAFYEERLAGTPDEPNHLYNLACAESLVGRHQDALEHIARAVELKPELLASAQEDADLDAIRTDPRFPT